MSICFHDPYSTFVETTPINGFISLFQDLFKFPKTSGVALTVNSSHNNVELETILTTSLYSIYFLQMETFLSNFLLWFAISISISSDIGGYIFGKTFGGKKLTKISPNKTISGLVGSFVFSLGSVFILGLILELMSNMDMEFFIKSKYFIFALMFSLVAQMGDLIISYFKRLEKIKDTGKLLPGHGGIFDRIDGLMFVILFAYILYTLKFFP